LEEYLTKVLQLLSGQAQFNKTLLEFVGFVKRHQNRKYSE
jgi:hypothetical protein